MKRKILFTSLILLTGIGLFAQTITIGTGTTTSNIWGPYHGATEDARFQYLISASELTSAGLPANDILTSLAFDVTTHNSSQAFTGFTIKIAHTTSTGFSFGAPFLSETFTTVYNGNYSTTGTGWNTHAFSTPFQWNGTNNIVIEICFDNSSTTASDYIHMTTSWIVPSSPTNKATGTGSGCSLSATGTGGWRPNMRFTHSNPSPCSTPVDQPTSLSLTNVTHNSIDGSFTSAVSSPDNYLVVVSTSSTLSSNPVDGTSYNSGDPLGGGSVVQASSSTSFNSTNLNSETTYYYYIFSYNSACSGGPLYNTTSPLTGNETTTTAPPTCDYSIKLVDTYGDSWNGGKITVYVESIAVITDATVTSGDNGGDWKIINFTVDDGGEITTDYTAGSYSSENEYYIYDAVDAGGTEVYSSGTGGSTPGDLGSGVLSASCPLPCTTPTDQPTVLNLSPDYYQIDGSYTAAVSSPDEYLVVISTSSSLSSNPIDGTTYSASDPLGGGTVVQAGSSTSFSATGLSMGTTYYFYIFSYNSECTGGPLYYTTSPLTNNETTLSCTVSAFPYSEDFDVLTPNNGTVNCVSTVDLSPVCWTNESGDDTDWVARSSSTASSSTGPSSDHTSGGNYLFIESSSCYSKTAIMTSPTFDVSSMSVPTLSFYYHMYGYTMGTLTVDAYYNGTWNNGIWTLSGDQGNAWYEAEVSIPGAAGFSDLKLRFSGLTGSDYYSDMAIDDVSIIDISCPDPSDLTATSITSNTADLSWTENGTATSWDIELGAGGFSPTGTPTQSSVTNPYTYSSLSSNTSYDYYVRADCGGSDYSNWIGPYNFSTLESCPDPSGLSASSITSSTADLNWTENGTATTWEIEYGLDGFAQGTGITIPGISSNPFTISGLTSNTSYDYYMRSDCGGGDYSSWVGPYSFNTPCAEYTVPYFEGFESGYTNGATIAGCLTQQSIVGAATWMANSTNTTYNRTPRTGSFNTTLYYGNTDWIFIPINLNSGTNYTVSLFARQDGATSTNANITVKYGTTASEAGMTNNIVAATGIINGTYQEITGDFSPASSGTFYIGILGYISSAPYYISMDDISIIEGPTCQDPSDLTATNITGYTADLSWTENGIATSWDIELGAGGFSPTGTPTHLSVWDDYTMNSLSPETSYDYYLRSDCGGGDYSSWIGPYNFSTIESCPDPSNLSTANITTSSADLSWTENGIATEWDIEYGAQGFTQGTGTTISATTDNPYSLSGLTSNTSYDYYVRSDCGGGDYSSWVGPYSFNTNCAEYSVPYFEGFESGYADGATIAGCLTQQSIAGTATWMANSSNTNYNRTPRTGSFNTTLIYSNSDWIFIPISLTAGKTYEISLFARQDGSTTSNASITISYGTSASAAGMTNSIVALTGLTSGNYQEISGEFSPSSTGIYYVGIFGAINGTPWYISLDDISIVELTPMSYVTSVTTQNTDYTYPADTDHHIIGIEIETFGYISPFDVTQFNINMNGSTDISDVSNINLYYSGTSSTFSTSNLFGTVSPATGTLSINGTQTLSEGTNYFWLTYDIASNATINNYVDAECVQITMNGGIGSQVPSTTAPSGNCQILYIITCEHKITLYDYENDGWGTYWNGSATVDRTVDVLLDGTPVLTDITLASGDNGTYYTFEVEEGATISTLVYGGSSQMKYIITGGNGDFVLEDGSNMTTPTGTSGTATCDFESLFTLNGDAYFSEASGAKANSSGDEITLTSDIKTQKSSAWFNYMLDLSEDFEIDFTMNFGTRNAGTGADGIVFSLQGDCLSCGGTGLSIGYGGISPSVGIEFDTYYNPTMTDYAPSGEWDHVAIFKNGSNDHAGTDVLAASVGLAQDAFSNVGITDGADYTATVKWTASSNLLEMYWNGSPTATISYSNDIVTNIFSGNNLVYWGFTSGTGLGTNKHTVKVTSYPTITNAAQLQDEEIDQGDTYQSELNDFAASYTWTPNDGTISNTAIHNPIFSPTVTTTYCCDIEDDCGNIIKDCFTLTVNSTLPVELLSFSANCLNDEVLLNWVTANEINSDYFVVQRSDDLFNWKDLTYVEAAGNSNHNLNYNYNDLLMKESIIYYRLKIVDMDGSFNNSNVITVSCKGESDFNFELYPNPVNQKLTVRFLNNDAESVKLYMTNSIGQIVYQTKFVELEFSTEINLDVSNLPEGIYMLNIVDNSSGRLVSRKLVKQKF